MVFLSSSNFVKLGKGELSTRKWPALVDRLNGAPVFSIVCGDQCSFALTVSGEVYGWGNNKVLGYYVFISDVNHSLGNWDWEKLKCVKFLPW